MLVITNSLKINASLSPALSLADYLLTDSYRYLMSSVCTSVSTITLLNWLRESESPTTSKGYEPSILLLNYPAIVMTEL